MLLPWAPLRVRLAALGRPKRALQALLATGVTAAAMALARTLLAISHTETVRFLPWRPQAGASLGPAQENGRLLAALALGQRSEGAPSSSPSGPFLLHLAMEDLCFLAEKGGLRLAAVFADDTGQTWRLAASAALRPAKAVTAALKHALQPADALGGSARQQRAIAAAARALGAQLQLAAWGVRAAGSLCASSRQMDRYGIAQLHVRTRIRFLPSTSSCIRQQHNRMRRRLRRGYLKLCHPPPDIFATRRNPGWIGC